MRRLSSETQLTKPLHDVVAERLILSSILAHGNVVYHDIASVIKERDFYAPENKFLYTVLTDLIVKDGILKPNVASICAKAHAIDSQLSNRFQLGDYVIALAQDSVSPDNVKPFVQRVGRFGLTRNLKQTLLESIDSLDQIQGNENILQILAKAEAPFTNFTTSLIQDDDIVTLSDFASGYAQHLAEQKPSARGIQTGYRLFDHYVGGGFRAPGIHMVAARAKGGKSFFALNVANNITKTNIPVLYLDTELTKELTLDRFLSLATGVDRSIIETGQFSTNPATSKQVLSIAKGITDSKQPFDYYNISGRHHDEWISIMRRWIMKRVGFDANGNTKPCLIILDYLKLMNLNDSGNFQEHQYLGQIMTDLHNFCVKYQIPMLAMCQLNRDGITKEDQSVISGSDRIIWLCSSFSLMKNKSPEDLASDPPQNGNKKLIVIATRFGAGNMDGEYINLHCDLAKSEIREGELNTNPSRPRLGSTPAVTTPRKETINMITGEVLDEDDKIII